MKRIEKQFSGLKRKREKALVAYLTAGYPDLGTTGELILALDRAGVDVLELGVPFSDPTADGPVIQGASQVALRNSVTLTGILDLVAVLRGSTEMPVILFSYYNPIFVFGTEQFARKAAAAGVDGVLVVDLPVEESAELRTYTDEAGLDFITLIAPTTGIDRAKKMLKRASGFIYYISLTGVTGSGMPVIDEVRDRVSVIRKMSDLPVVAGFGISNPSQAREIAAAADGVVVGSAFVRLIGEHAGRPDLAHTVETFARSLKEGIG
ncbi:MAG TPA: tryptophan synthase subunit alpha [Syntrophales bacterium]|nr:tryptophan synthase subunit alpha [Syntrophales bacterium]HOX94351.1 tryptophan synthase subunit alpha [Syntrophales bacterium]HPI57096.1 tryptophan synthase subunit alpha [Syntrophales bacterium]HPN24817.1 tryptophan synthase subunit alpha [Syntrophales bacterium]HQM30104.1 tryptophan synthase subunit alpha [Syntrophales bacterium]